MTHLPSAKDAGAEDIQTHFTALLRGWAASVSVISARSDDQQPHAMTASSFTPVSIEPPTVLVCVNKKASLFQALRAEQPFCVNLLGAEQSDIAILCSDNSRAAQRFVQASWQDQQLGGSGETAIPFLTDAQALLFCRYNDSLDAGTHGIFIGEVVAARHTGVIAPLLYVDRAWRQLNSSDNSQ